MFLYGKKVLYWFFFFFLTFFYSEKYKRKRKEYVSHSKNIFLYRKCLLQTKPKSFLNIFMVQKKIYLIIKNIFVKTSLWTQ